MATFAHITPARCTQLGNALTAAGLAWEHNGNQARPELLTYTVTDPQGRRWAIDAATSNQITPSRPASLWQAQCATQMRRDPGHVRPRARPPHSGLPRMTGPLRPWRPDDFDDRCETCGAAPGQLCKPWCDTGYTAEDFRRDAERHDQAAEARPHRPPPETPASHPRP